MPSIQRLLLLVTTLLAASSCNADRGRPDQAWNPLAPEEDDDQSPDDQPQAQCEDEASGHAPLRRLTRRQHARAIRDLTGVALDPSALPPDERVGPFASNVVAPVSELGVEAYMNAAEQVAASPALSIALPCTPSGPDDAACRDAFIETFGRRALRRPVLAEEREHLRMLFEMAAGDGFDDGVRLVVEAVLQSPSFLYHVELGRAPADGLRVALDDWELAARLSFSIWGSVPDDALLDAADAGELVDPERIEAHARRMLDDPRAAEAMGEILVEWLGVETLPSAVKDPLLFPDYDSALAEAMLAETRDFGARLHDEDPRVSTLLTSTRTRIAPALWSLYGLSGPLPTETTTVDLDPEQRAGVLTLASVLATHAHPDQSAPVARDALVRERLMCQPLPVPPADVDNVPPPVDPDATTRERFEQHSSDPACEGCHALIDGLGFGFEHYDAVGGFRSTDAGQPVDARGEIVGTGEIDGPYEGVPQLAEFLAHSRIVHDCVRLQMFRHVLGREPEPADECALSHVDQAFADSDGDLRELMVALVTSDAFRFRPAL